MTARAPQLEGYAAPYTSPQPAAGECVTCGEPAPHVPAAIDPDYAQCPQSDFEACMERAVARRREGRGGGAAETVTEAAGASTEPASPSVPEPVTTELPKAPRTREQRVAAARKAALEKPPGE